MNTFNIFYLKVFTFDLILESDIMGALCCCGAKKAGSGTGEGSGGGGGGGEGADGSVGDETLSKVFAATKEDESSGGSSAKSSFK